MVPGRWSGSGRVVVLATWWLTALLLPMLWVELPPAAAELAEIVRFDAAEAAARGAVCIDGSAPAFYFLRGTGDGANKFFVYFEGGGWCTSSADCADRSTGDLGSSLAYPDTFDVRGIGNFFSADPAKNPLLATWNVVYMKYCDGGSYTGDTTDLYAGETLFYRGARIMDMLFDVLRDELGTDSATDIVVAGGSAGGLTAFLHADKFNTDRFPSAKHVVAMPDSGFFLAFDSKTDDACAYRSDLEWVFEAMNSSGAVNPSCLAAYTAQGASGYECMFAQNTIAFSATPTFALQSRFDTYQTGEELCSDANATARINAFGEVFEQEFLRAMNIAPHGALLDSCAHHIWTVHNDVIVDLWNNISSDDGGWTQQEAFSVWFDSVTAARPQAEAQLFTQLHPYKCDRCCVYGDE